MKIITDIFEGIIYDELEYSKLISKRIIHSTLYHNITLKSLKFKLGLFNFIIEIDYIIIAEKSYISKIKTINIDLNIIKNHNLKNDKYIKKLITIRFNQILQQRLDLIQIYELCKLER